MGDEVEESLWVVGIVAVGLILLEVKRWLRQRAHRRQLEELNGWLEEMQKHLDDNQ